MAAKKKELLECKTRNQVLAFAKANKLPVRDSNKDKVKVGGWTCVFTGDRFQYVE